MAKFPRLKPGDKLPRQAAAWNALSATQTPPTASTKNPRPAPPIYLANHTGGPIRKGQAVKIGAAIRDADNLERYRETLVFRAEPIPNQNACNWPPAVAIAQTNATADDGAIFPGLTEGVSTAWLADPTPAAGPVAPNQAGRFTGAGLFPFAQLVDIFPGGEFGKVYLKQRLPVGGLIRFQLLTNIGTLDAEAVAIALAWNCNAGAYEWTGDPFTIKPQPGGVWGPAPGILEAGVGATGWCERNEKTKQAEIVFMQRFALFIHATTTTPFDQTYRAFANVDYHWRGLAPTAQSVLIVLPPSHQELAATLLPGTKVTAAYDEKIDGYRIIEIATALRTCAADTCPDEQGNQTWPECQAEPTTEIVFGHGTKTRRDPQNPGRLIVEAPPEITVCNLENCPEENADCADATFQADLLMFGVGLTVTEIGEQQDCQRHARITGGIQIQNFDEAEPTGPLYGFTLDPCLEIVTTQDGCWGLLRPRPPVFDPETDWKDTHIVGIFHDDGGGYYYGPGGDCCAALYIIYADTWRDACGRITNREYRTDFCPPYSAAGVPTENEPEW